MRRCVNVSPAGTVKTPQFSSGSAPQAVSVGIYPLRRFASCGSNVCLTKLPSVPCKTKRGRGAAARMVERSTARTRALAPGAGLELRPVAVVIRFESDDAAKNSVRNKFSNGLKIAVVAAVLIDREQAACILRNRHQRLGVVESCGKGLVNQHVAARCKALPRELIMCVVGRGDDDQMDFLDGEEIIQISNDPNVGVFLGCLAAAPLQNSGKMQTRHGANHRSVKRAPGKPKSNESYFNHFALLPSLLRELRRRCAKCLAPA